MNTGATGLGSRCCSRESSNAAAPPFGKAILPRRGRCGRLMDCRTGDFPQVRTTPGKAGQGRSYSAWRFCFEEELCAHRMQAQGSELSVKFVRGLGLSSTVLV